MANNIAKTYIEYTQKNITQYLKLIEGSYYNKQVADPLLETYINIRYYNSYEPKYPTNPSKNINYYLKQKALSLKESSPEDETYITQVKITFYLYQYILYLDNVLPYPSLKPIIEDLDSYHINTLNQSNSIKEELTNLIKENEKRKEKYLNTIEDPNFTIKLIKTNKKKITIAQLANNIKFNRIYSSYSINKVYNEGLVNEQKNIILYYLITQRILKEKIQTNYENQYLIDFPCSIFNKPKKQERLINIINNEAIKDSLILRFTYTDYQNHKQIIESWIKEGYQIAIEIDDQYNNDKQSQIWLDIFKYIIISPSQENQFPKEKTIIKE